MRKTDFTKALTEYFSIYLPTTCGVSPNTTNSYRDTFKQLLLFFQEKKAGFISLWSHLYSEEVCGKGISGT